MTAPAPVRAAGPRRLLWLLGWVALTVYFAAPPREAMTPDLDPSNHGTYAWMFAEGKRYGAEVVPMAGPFGFLLYGTTYSGELYLTRYAGDLALKGVFAWLLLWIFAQAPRDARRWLWLAALVVFLPNVDDTLYDSTLLLGGLALMHAGTPRPRLPHLVVIALLGFLALTKGNQLTLSALTLGAVGLHAVLQGRPGWLLPSALVWSGTVAFAWTLAGQRVTDFPAFVQGISALTSGYNETMGLDESREILLVGLAIIGGLALNLALLAWRSRQWRLAACFVFLAGFTFVKWKHGYVRADGHVHLLFNYALVLLPTLWLFAPHWTGPRAGGPAWRVGLATTGLATFLIALAAASDFWGLRFWAMFRDLPARAARHADYVIRPARFRAPLDEQLKQQRIAADLPQIRNEVGHGTVDFFGFEQGVLLLNELRYHPRPMGGGTFNVFNRHLQQRNEDFIRDPARRPDFQVMKFRSLDERWPAMNDGPTFNALVHLYSPVLIQRDFMLFRTRPGIEAPRPRRLSEHPLRLGESFAVPEPPAGQMLLFTLRAPPSARGWLRTALYRAPLLEAEITTERHPRPRRFRLAPAMLKEPAVLSPFLADNLDVVRLFGPAPGDRVRTFRLVTADPAHFDATHLRLVLHTLPRPPAPPDTDVEEIITYMQHPLHNRAPLRLQTEETGIRELNKEPITLVHAPGTLDFPLETTDQQVIFSYGLMPQTWDPGSTDGVEFNVELISPDGSARTLFRQLLRPVSEPAHRGMQRARVYFPPRLEPGSILRLRTGAGPAGDGAWDQSYITRLQIKAGGDDPRRYFGFHPSALAAELATAPEFTLDGALVRGVHPPFHVEFPCPPQARRVLFAGGLMPGAYTGDGRTDGVEFSLDALRPDGTRQRLWQRLIDPRAQAADRGLVTAEIPLPPLPPGTRLLLATAAGPHGDLGWDWAVLRTLYVE